MYTLHYNYALSHFKSKFNDDPFPTKEQRDNSPSKWVFRLGINYGALIRGNFGHSSIAEGPCPQRKGHFELSNWCSLQLLKMWVIVPLLMYIATPN